MAERHEKQYLASASAKSDAKDKKDQGAKQSSSASGGNPKETVRVKAVPIVLLRSIAFRAVVLLKATVLLRVAFSVLAGLVSFVVR